MRERGENLNLGLEGFVENNAALRLHRAACYLLEIGGTCPSSSIDDYTNVVKAMAL